MFTWVCQRCGKENDVAEVECPQCAVDRGRTALGSAHGADRKQAVDSVYEPERPRSSQRFELPLPPPVPAAPPSPAHSLAVRPIHLMLFGLVLVASLLGAVYLARPDLVTVEGVSLPKLPKLGSREAPPLQQGPIEVAGVRAWRDAQSKLRVRAVLVNHQEGPAADTSYRIALYRPDAEGQAPPAATFDIQLESPLGARESREVEADLAAPDGLTALPEWNRMRIALEPAPAAE